MRSISNEIDPQQPPTFLGANNLDKTKTMRASPYSRDRSWWVVVAAAFLGMAGFVARWASVRNGQEPASLVEIFPPGPWLVAVWVTLLALAVTIVAHLLVRVRWLSRGTSGEVSSAEITLPLRQALTEVRSGIESALSRTAPDVARALDEVLRGAIVVGASDIHLNPGRDRLTVNYRVDGVICEVATLRGAPAERAVSRVKVLTDLDVYERGPQDGTLRRRVGDVDIEARVSTLPANHGERVVLRLVISKEVVPSLSELGFPQRIGEQLGTLLQKPQGMIYVSGPVGSGKTTTMYSALSEVHRTRGETTSLVTLEDPIEMQLSFATQTQINPKVGLDFPAALRSILRQDPGAIMLGEIRDRETARIATQAGLTGHLILTTVHVHSAAGTFDRLIEMDVERFVLVSSCLGCLAQRLVRKLCVHCRTEESPTETTLARFRAMGHELDGETFFAPGSCEHCQHRGYSGRAPVAELLVMTDALSEVVQRGGSRSEIEATARSEGMISILECSLTLARQGVTSLQEVLRVAG